MPDTPQDDWWTLGDYGSYGMNWWIVSGDVGQPYGGGDWQWKNVFHKSPNRIPVFGRCQYSIAMPHHTNDPPAIAYDTQGIWPNMGMKFFAPPQHGWYINMLFMDWSVRPVPLKGLWNLKWHKGYDLNYLKPDWATEAPWMLRCPEE